MDLKSAKVPEALKPLFREAEELVRGFFRNQKNDPSKGRIEVEDNRYILVSGESLSKSFFSLVRTFFGPDQRAEADHFAATLLYDLAHIIGKSDAAQFHNKLDLDDPISKLSVGPIHFAYTGWAFVDILDESRPSPDENYYIVYEHPYSFEADSWLTHGKATDSPACIMNAGYSSGWCEQSFGMPLESIELSCRACGDDQCRFIMAPPDRLAGHVASYLAKHPEVAKRKLWMPDFFSREAIRSSGEAGEDVQERTAAERQIFRYARQLESTQSSLKEKVSSLEDEILERQKVEQQLRESEKYKQILFEQSPVGLVLSTLEGNLVTVNPAFARLIGYSVEECCELSYSQLAPPQYDKLRIKELAKLKETGRYGPCEKELIHRNGSHIPIMQSGLEIRLGGKDFLWSSILDITEQKSLEETQRQLNTELEARVQMGEVELKKTQGQLIEASRHADMAEVTTGVLHNVKNVLNSVNIAASQVGTILNTSKLQGLSRLVDLLEENADHLEEYLSRDEKGKMIPAYMRSMTTVLQNEQDDIRKELRDLVQNIEHIKSIVAVQQSYSKVSDVIETCTLEEVISDALQINSLDLSQEYIIIELDYDEIPAVTIAKQKILQVLVNLLSNAKNALSNKRTGERKITIRTRKVSSTNASIQIIDTGIGIDKESLEKVFDYGYTTRKKGHGFGLHSSDIAVKELGGSLTVESEGLNHGATFTLLFPFYQPLQKAL